MANTKISEDPVATTIVGTETIPMLQGGVNKRTTVNDIINDKNIAQIIDDKLYVNNTAVSSTFYVADTTALQAIPKIADNNNLIVHVESMPTNKSLFIYKHAQLRWICLGQPSIPANSIFYLGDTYIAQTGYPNCPNPTSTPRKPYYSSTTVFTNIGAYIRGFLAAAGCGTGSGTLAFNKTTKELTWTAPGDSPGSPVDVSIGGWYRLESFTSNKECCVCIRAFSEPASTVSDSVTISGIPTTVTSLATYPGMFNAKYGNPFGERQYFYVMNGLDALQALLCSSQWEDIESDISVIDLLSVSGRSVLATADVTLADLITIVKKRQAIGSKVIVVAPTVFNSLSDVGVTTAPYLIRKLKILAETNNFDVVDVSRYFADPAGTISNPTITNYLNSSNQQFLSIIGSLVKEKYGFTPALSKYLPIRNKLDNELVPYSITETYGNLLTNGRLTGTSGTKSHARVTGDVPTSNTVSVSTTSGHTMTAVCTSPDSSSPIARGDGLPGNIFRIALDNVAVDAELCTFTQTSSISASNYVAGDTLQFSGEMKISATGEGIYMTEGYLSANNLYHGVFSTVDSTNTPAVLNNETLVLQFVSTPVILQTGVTTLNFIIKVQMKAGGSATIDISPNLCIKKVLY